MHEAFQLGADAHERSKRSEARHAAFHHLTGAQGHRLARASAAALRTQDELARDEHTLPLAVDFKDFDRERFAQERARAIAPA